MQLLKKTIGYYFTFSALLLLGAIPMFYFTMKTIVTSNADENLRAVKTRIMPQLLKAASLGTDGNLNVADYDIVFHRQITGNRRDSVYSLYLSGTLPGELLPARGMLSYFTFNQAWYSVEIKTSMVDKILLVKKIALLLVTVILLLLTGLLVINWRLRIKIWRPFYSTLAQLKSYRVDKMDQLTIQKSSVKEFNDLNEAIEQLTQRDRHAYDTQKEFSENASHEMQSPLAVFQSKLELLMQTNPLTEEQTFLITDLASASKRMLRLNKSLLLLTRIDNNQFFEKEPLSIREMLQKLLQQYEFQVDRKFLQVAFDMHADITVTANKTLIEILLGNLLSNAIRHSVTDGSLNINFNGNKLTIQNTGKPTALNALKLFKRFQKESADVNSLGLGLEIVNKICLLNHYTIQYHFTDQMHSFSLIFDPA